MELPFFLVFGLMSLLSLLLLSGILYLILKPGDSPQRLASSSVTAQKTR